MSTAPSLTTATAARVTDAATGAPVRTVRLGKRHPALVSIASALESHHPGTYAAFTFGRSHRLGVFGVTLYHHDHKPACGFQVELQA